MSDYYIISDTHFRHKMLIDSGLRPSSYEKQLESSLKLLTFNDVLIHLGDVCLGMEYEVHRDIIWKLKCRKFLVRGNHDKRSTSWYMDHGWDFAGDALTMRRHGKEILFSHEPAHIRDTQVNVHGHVHSEDRLFEYKDVLTPNHILAVPEKWGYSPVKLRRLV